MGPARPHAKHNTVTSRGRSGGLIFLDNLWRPGRYVTPISNRRRAACIRRYAGVLSSPVGNGRIWDRSTIVRFLRCFTAELWILVTELYLRLIEIHATCCPT